MNDLYPFISPTEDLVLPSSEPLPTYYDIGWDFEKEIPLIENGDFKIVSENEAIKVWVWHTLKTSRYEHSIYSWDFGNEIKSLYGEGYSSELTKAEAERYIKEALGLYGEYEKSILNPYILDAKIVSISFDKDVLSATIDLDTIYEGGVTVNV